MKPASTYDLDALYEGLSRLQGESAVRNTIARYMALCDVPLAGTPGPAMAALFTDDAIWEGIGAEYAQKFGKQQGRDAVVAFVKSYLPPTAHFRSNVHCLSSEAIQGGGGTARGLWLMQQISEYQDGRTELICARLEIDFRRVDGAWQIAHFRTERLIDRPLPLARKVVDTMAANQLIAPGFDPTLGPQQRPRQSWPDPTL